VPLSPQLVTQLHALADEDLHIEEGCPLGTQTTYGLGGRAAMALFPRTPDALARVVARLTQLDTAYSILGGGSNVLMADKGCSVPAVVLSRMSTLSVQDTTITAMAGVLSARIAEEALAHGLTGAEFLTALPGSIGGAAFMNARAFGREMSDILEDALVVDPEGRLSTLTTTPGDFAYKVSPFRSRQLLVARVTLRLAPGDPVAVRAAMEANAAHRRRNGEDRWPSCGCVFKNPYSYGQSAGKIIDDLGLKGFGTENAWVHREHANFIVHNGRATSSEVRWVMEEVRRRVFEAVGVELEFEVEFEGDWDKP